MFDKSLPVTGFKPQISDVGGDRSTNWATTTAQVEQLVCRKTKDAPSVFVKDGIWQIFHDGYPWQTM